MQTRIPYLSVIPEFVVDNVVETAAFYCDVLNFELVGLTGVGDRKSAWLRQGYVELVFRSSEPDTPIKSKPSRGSTYPVLHFYVQDITSLYEHVSKRVPVLRELEPTLFGVGEFAIQDLNGMVLRFTQPQDIGALRVPTTPAPNPPPPSP